MFFLNCSVGNLKYSSLCFSLIIMIVKAIIKSEETSKVSISVASQNYNCRVSKRPQSLLESPFKLVARYVNV